jgi:hypothetical protein
MNTQTITSFIRNPLSFFVSEPIEEIADWSPSQYDIVLFLAEDGTWKTGSYQLLWAELRPLRSETDNREINFEANPYDPNGAIMAKVNWVTRNEAGEWVSDFMFSYADVANILPFNAGNIEYALLANQAHANSVKRDLAVA